MLYAFPEVYEEQEQIKSELALISVIERELAEEKRKKAPKFAPIARKYLPDLRKIYWNGQLREEARRLIQELTLEQTMPLAELDLPYEADSYTGEVDDEPRFQGLTEWDRDYLEVQREIQLLEEPNSVLPYLDEDTYDGVRRLMTEPTPETPRPTVITAPRGDPPLEVRIAQEYSNAEMAVAAMEASKYNEWDNDDHPWYEDGVISSVPLTQNETMEMRVNPGLLADYRREVQSLIGAIKQRRTEFFDWCDVNSDKLIRYANNRNIDTQDAKIEVWRRMIDKSLERQEFIDKLNEMAQRGVEPQYLAMLFMGIQDDDWGLLESDAALVKIPANDELIPVGAEAPEHFGTLLDVIEMWGDEILDEAFDPISVIPEMTDEQIRKLADQWTEEIIQMQFVDTFADDVPVHQTQAYARGVFSSMNGNDLNLAGIKAYMREKVSIGSIAASAFLTALKAGKTLKEAWHAYYNAGTVIGVKKDGLRLKTEVGGKVLFVNYGLAKWKLQVGEIHLDADDRLRLKGILTANGWGRELVPVL